ncbi:unnamed protein product, partial [marine sediment metagenome]
MLLQNLQRKRGTYEFFDTRILYTVNKELNLLILFVLGFSDEIKTA